MLGGDLRALDEIEIEGEIKIDGDLITNKRVDNDGDLEVTGTIVEHADLSPVDLPEISFSADGPSHNVPEYGALTLEPGSYGRVKVRKYASLYLSTGTYFFRELDTDPHAMVVIDLKDGPVTLNVEDELDIDDYVEIRAHSGVSRDLTFNCEEGGTIDIEKYARVFGTIVAPHARVKFNRGSTIQGAVYAEKVKMDDESRFVFHNDQINPPPQPPPPPQVNYRSIGIESGVLDDSSLATVGLGDDTVTFEDDSLPDNIGRGDKLILAPGTDTEEMHFIHSRDGPANSACNPRLPRSIPPLPMSLCGPIPPFRTGKTIARGTWCVKTGWKSACVIRTDPLREMAIMRWPPLTVQ
jgi:cytoskeletal protein CcmA (bactofilin family)